MRNNTILLWCSHPFSPSVHLYFFWDDTRNTFGAQNQTPRSKPFLGNAAGSRVFFRLKYLWFLAVGHDCKTHASHLAQRIDALMENKQETHAETTDFLPRLSLAIKPAGTEQITPQRPMQMFKADPGLSQFRQPRMQHNCFMRVTFVGLRFEKPQLMSIARLHPFASG